MEPTSYQRPGQKVYEPGVEKPNSVYAIPVRIGSQFRLVKVENISGMKLVMGAELKKAHSIQIRDKKIYYYGFVLSRDGIRGLEVGVSHRRSEKLLDAARKKYPDLFKQLELAPEAKRIKI